MTVRGRAVRRALARVRITDDSSMRARSVTPVGADWVWPYWLERQLDPASPAFVPRGQLAFPANVTARNWTAVGNIGSALEAIVDPRGLVTPWLGGWSLDWWIGADDRWHLPSREVAVRQRLIDDTPVLETAMRVPTGDAVQRVFAIQGDHELVVVEIENRSKLPFAVALAIRPFNPEGLAAVERIGLRDGTTVTVDGRVAMVLPKSPSRMAASTLDDGDVASVVLGGDAGESFPDVRDEAGLASAAFIFPLAHTATLRVALPMGGTDLARRRGFTRRSTGRAPALPSSIPSAEQVARGWKVHAERGMRIVIPDTKLSSCVAAQRAFLLLLHDGDGITPGPSTSHRFEFRDAAFMLGALDRYGYAPEAAEVLQSYPGRQHANGFFSSQRRQWDSNGAALHAIAEHWRLHRDRALVEKLAPSVAKGAEWIERKRHSRDAKREAAQVGLLPPSGSAEHLGAIYWDDLWSVRGLLDAAEVLTAAGESGAAADAARMAASLRDDLDRSLELTADRLGTLAVPAGPRRRIDPAIIGSLAAVWPLRVMDADDKRMLATADAVREHFLVGDAFFQGMSDTGLGTYLTLQLAFAELEVGDRHALDRLDWLLGAATPTWTWPEAIHPRLPGGCMGDGQNGRVAADVLTFARNLLVRDIDDGLALCTLVPDSWLGQGVELHDAPTHRGLLSFAIRWHGDRPAVLWELVPHDGITSCRFTVPGLDPSWTSTELSGEALLAPVAPPGQVSAVSLRRP